MNWQTLKSTYAFLCPWLKVRKDHVRLPSGLEMDDFYVIESNDWVNVIAITEDGKIIIEEQYRHGIQRVCFELPAGNVSEGETPLAAAKRELLEETGYAEGKWSFFCSSVPNASGMNTVCHTFIVTGARKLQEPHLEGPEEIHVHFCTPCDVKQLLENNSICEGVIQAPLWKYLSEI